MPKKKQTTTITEYEITNMLEEKFSPPAYAYLPQVRNGTGFQRETRTADALVFSLYPSRGLDIYGIEIKTSKADLKNELKAPDKSDSIARYCDYWWLAVHDKKITEGLVIPGAWGIMECQKKVKVIKQAEKTKAKPIDRLQLAAIMRKLQETVGWEQEIEKRLQEKRKEVWEEGYNCGKKTKAREKKEFENMKEQVKKFEEETGIKIYSPFWDGGGYMTKYQEIRDALRIIEVSKQGGSSLFQQFEYLGRMGAELSRKCQAINEEVQKIYEAKKKPKKKQTGQEKLFEEDNKE